MLKYDLILRCYLKMMYWHFNADVKAAGGGGSGNMLGKTKRREGEREKERSGERGGRGGGGLLQMLGRDLGDCPRLSLSLM